MRVYGRVASDFWIEAKEQGLSDDGRQLMVYLMTCHHGNSIGCFRMPVAYIADDLVWGFERVTETLSETVSKGFLERDEERSWNRLPTRFQTVSIDNPNVAKGMEQFINAVPKESFLFKNLLEYLKPYEKRFRNGYLNGLANPLLNGLANPSETEVAVSSCSSLRKNLTLELESARKPEFVDKSGKPIDFNNFNMANIVLCKMLGRVSLTLSDQQLLRTWCQSLNIEQDVLPYLEMRVKNYMRKNTGLPDNPLSYFHSGLSEHLAKNGIK